MASLRCTIFILSLCGSRREHAEAADRCHPVKADEDCREGRAVRTL